LNFTTEVETKPVPFTVNVKAAPPAGALVGAIDLSVGAGLFTVKICAFEVPPPGAGFETVTLTVPAVAMSAPGIVAVICVLVVDEGVIAEFAPKFNVAPFTKPVPFTVNVKAAPTCGRACGGNRRDGRRGLVTAKVDSGGGAPARGRVCHSYRETPDSGNIRRENRCGNLVGNSQTLWSL